MRETPQAAAPLTTQTAQLHDLHAVTPANAVRRPRKPGPMRADVRRRAQQVFLASYARLGNITVACKAATIERHTVYDWLEKDTAFATAYKQADADAADMLYAEAFRRAVQGVEKTVVSMGKIVMVDGKPFTEREYSDMLLLNLLRARDPRFRQQPADGSATATAQMQVVFMLPPQGATPDGARTVTTTVEADATPPTTSSPAIAIEFPPLDNE